VDAADGAHERSEEHEKWMRTRLYAPVVAIIDSMTPKETRQSHDHQPEPAGAGSPREAATSVQQVNVVLKQVC